MKALGVARDGAADQVEGHGAPDAGRQVGEAMPRLLDAPALQELLKQQLEKSPPESREATPSKPRWKPMTRRLAKSAAALAIAVVIGWEPLTGLLQTTSVEAVVNARLVSLRAPIDGELIAPAGMPVVGTTLNGALTLLKVENERADRGRLDDLRRQLGQAEEDRDSIGERLAVAEASIVTLKDRTDAFLKGRIAQLEARKGELQSRIAIAEARQREAAASHARSKKLSAAGTTSTASFEQAERDALIAAGSVEEARYQLRAVEVELNAARSGSFLGDSYNDRPSSAQRLDEMEARAGDLKAGLAARMAQIERLKQELAYETQRHAEVATAPISVPATGRVWEVLAAPGESVSKGQDLMRLLDCSGAVVTAAVSETVYNGLHVGMPAKFQFRHDGKMHDANVVNLTGIAGAPSNFAIQPSALSKEPYRVTVAVPDLAREAGCDVGRTGRVVFDETSDQGVLRGIAEAFRVALR